jgi:hypothetical protein
MESLNTEKRLVWRQDSHVATLRPFAPNSHGLVGTLLPVFSPLSKSRKLRNSSAAQPA